MRAPELEFFFDGQCPLCRREVAIMRRLDRRGRLRFTDIAAPGFEAHADGPDAQALNARLHARVLPEGRWIDGVEVFRRAWGALGFRWLVPFTRLPGVRQALDRAYSKFAANRLHLTGRCDHDSCRPAA